MFKVSVMYPNIEGALFNCEYYLKTHIKLVEKNMKSFGLVKTEVEKGLPDGEGHPPIYICVGHLYFDKIDGYIRGIAEKGSILRGDIANFTNISPVRQFSEILT